ncbi:MAG TPA: helix-turn-helix domain-containing protein [Streptosporangiaceae bacterium]
MLTVGKDGADVERLLAAGAAGMPGVWWPAAGVGACPAAGSAEAGEGCWLLRPRRVRCAGCGGTHVLLPASVLVRRADGCSVIGAALADAAAGMGHRQVAERAGRPASTVRGWLRRFTARAAAGAWARGGGDQHELPLVSGPRGGHPSVRMISIRRRRRTRGDPGR